MNRIKKFTYGLIKTILGILTSPLYVAGVITIIAGVLTYGLAYMIYNIDKLHKIPELISNVIKNIKL